MMPFSIRVSLVYVMGKFEYNENDSIKCCVWVSSVCLALYMFSSNFYKKLVIIIFLLCRWGNKHRKVQQTAQVCTAREWQSSDSKPNLSNFLIPLPLVVSYCLLVYSAIIQVDCIAWRIPASSPLTSVGQAWPVVFGWLYVQVSPSCSNFPVISQNYFLTLKTIIFGSLTQSMTWRPYREKVLNMYVWNK